ncbi:MAG: hypothetical protein JW986_00515 [Methanotrichaceae archaeon]|nr:hypothetical protein [Methanotrichaceae archaeon]
MQKLTKIASGRGHHLFMVGYPLLLTFHPFRVVAHPHLLLGDEGSCDYENNGRLTALRVEFPLSWWKE